MIKSLSTLIIVISTFYLYSQNICTNALILGYIENSSDSLIYIADLETHKRKCSLLYNEKNTIDRPIVLHKGYKYRIAIIQLIPMEPFVNVTFYDQISKTKYFLSNSNRKNISTLDYTCSKEAIYYINISYSRVAEYCYSIVLLSIVK